MGGGGTEIAPPPSQSRYSPPFGNRLMRAPLTSTSPLKLNLLAPGCVWVGRGIQSPFPSIWPSGQRAGGPSGPARVGEEPAVAVPRGRGRSGPG